MITLEFNAGMASKNLVTDPERMLAAKENVYLIVSNEKLDIKTFSESLSIIQNQAASSSFFRRGAKKLDERQFEIFLDDLINGRKISAQIPVFSTRVVIISKGIDPTTLAAIEVLKMRGICELLAIDLSSISNEGALFHLMNELKNEELCKKDFLTLYKASKGLSVVSGLAKTIISTEHNVNQIIRNFPTLVTKIEI